LTLTAERLGEIAALGTALLWSLTYVQFTLAVRKIGAARLNRLRLLAALALLMVTHAVLFRAPVPLHAEPARWGWLILSGVIGFAVSDAMLFSALLHLGAHRTSLVMALVPVFSALLAWGAFGERLTSMQVIAALVTLAGVTVVVSARSDPSGREADHRTGVGILFALGAAAAQSLRYVLSKQGMTGGFPVVSANTMQIAAATAAVWALALLRGEVRDSFAALVRRRAVPTTVGGAITGPFLGVTLSLVALAKAPVGIASTLMALPPIALLPLSRLLFKEAVTARAVFGTALAVGGVALLFLS
jgi:drug/metabolite transporter (DMT)-like permease